MILLVYVDDIIVVGSSDDLLQSFITFLKTEFAMKDLGPLHYFLGIESTYDSSAKKLLLIQKKYSLDLPKKHDMLGCKPCKTPVAQGQRASVCDRKALSDSTSFRSLVGGLQYLTLTRPDISFAVNYVSQFLHCPTDTHLQLAKRILRYIKGSLGQGLTLSSGDFSDLQAYRDSDWAGFPDTQDEYSGLANANATAKILWLSYPFEELSVYLSLPCKLFCDNQSAGSLTANPFFHARTKHIEIADIFTKDLSKSQFSVLKAKLMPHVRTSV
ncbi:uncharacterized protein LOC113291405 [Papaver somniferum]|uniref:uncharacterized protein LOC113291405 n=1 Tax=Papaver somniferum TaxID=3469 RepID=UPI000E6FE0EE|nr:uncharacterized protein LOC113291405 [Papaver somniferum]